MDGCLLMMLLIVVAALRPMKLAGGAMLLAPLCEGTLRIAVRKLVETVFCCKRATAIMFSLLLL